MGNTPRGANLQVHACGPGRTGVGIADERFSRIVDAMRIIDRLVPVRSWKEPGPRQAYSSPGAH